MRSPLFVSAMLVFASCNKDEAPGTGLTDDTGAGVSATGYDMRPSNPLCTAPSRPTPPDAAVSIDRFGSVQTGGSAIWLGMAPGDDDYWYVAEQGGRLVRFANDPSVSDYDVVLDIQSLVNVEFEQGLLGVAFHPDFATNGTLFLHYNTRSGGSTDTRIVKVTSSDGGASIDTGSSELVLQVDQPYTNHNGGHIEFGPDGYLYISLGDGGSGGDPLGHGQNRNTLLGTILRLDVDGGDPYGIPADNPFVDGGGAPEIYAWGLRNVWRFSFDRATGELWAGDVGQDRREEVSIIERGGNYGWADIEGMLCYPGGSDCDRSGVIGPVLDYRQEFGRSVVGGVVYRGSDIPALAGRYVFGDFYNTDLWAVGEDPVTSDATVEVIGSHGQAISHYAEDPSGELFLLSYNGRVYEVNEAGSTIPDDFPQRLSQTGCVDADNPAVAAEGVIPYSLQHTFWSDGADKERYLAVPDGATVDVTEDGDLVFPEGTVTIKHFIMGTKRVETRLFVRHDDGWAGYSYAWRDDQSDADLVQTTAAVEHDSGTWRIPNRGSCLSCHTEAANYSLGLELSQLDFAIDYPTGRTANQIATLEHIGLIDSNTVPSQLPPIDGDASVEDRARAYLHVNCASCHQPDGGGGGDLDLRFTTALADTNVCAEPDAGTLGLPDAQIVAPGAPDSSVLLERMASDGAARMPPVASHVVDTQGVALIREWITGMSSCD